MTMEMTDDEESLSVFPLHQHPNFMKQCCDLVNEEWPRSETARMLSMTTSCDKMPTCLILVTSDKKVIGHCKLTPIPSIPKSCFIESVVISKSMRGKGLGTFLMSASEKYCRTFLLLSTIYLSTKGQEKFYEKLGYSVCEPVTIYGGYLQQKSNAPSTNNNNLKDNGLPYSAPIPPPMPTLLSKENSSKPSKIFMMKSILI